jgi:hypothetical protein
MAAINASGDVLLNNNTAYQMKDSGAVTRNLLNLDGSNDLYIGSGHAGGTYIYANGSSRISISNAGAVTIPGTLGVTGTSTMAAINASAKLTITRLAGDFVQLTTGTRSVYLSVDSQGFGIFTGASQAGTGLYVNEVAGSNSVTGTLGVTGNVTATAPSYFRAATTSNSAGTFNFYLSATGIREDTSGGFNIDTFSGSWGNRLNITASGAVTIPGIVGIGGAATNGSGYSALAQIVAGPNAALSLKKTDATAQEWILDVVSGGAFRLRDVTASTAPLSIAASTGVVTMSAYGAGAATFSAAGVISSVSDETWKTKDGIPADPDAMIQKLSPGYWYYNEAKRDTFGTDRQLGFYAQNVNAAIGPEAAPEPEEGKPWGYYDRSVLAVVVMSLQSALTNIQTLAAEFQAYKDAHP